MNTIRIANIRVGQTISLAPIGGSIFPIWYTVIARRLSKHRESLIFDLHDGWRVVYKREHWDCLLQIDQEEWQQ